MIHLDTGFLIGALRRGSMEDRRLRRWLSDGELVGVSVISWAEFLCGPVVARDVDLAGQLLDEPIPFLAVDAGPSARLFNLTGRRRGSLNDCMITAIALRNDASVATTNVADFRRFAPAGLHLA